METFPGTKTMVKGTIEETYFLDDFRGESLKCGRNRTALQQMTWNQTDESVRPHLIQLKFLFAGYTICKLPFYVLSWKQLGLELWGINEKHIKKCYLFLNLPLLR